MPIQTDLSASPYFDDFKDQNNYYKILFQPGAAVQAREMNQLQTTLQRQIERFGDNIFKNGTIIDGCHMTFHDVFPYVKIKDSEADGTPVNVSEFENLYVKNSGNLQAYIVKTTSGYESRNPNLNTLYVRYINSGDDYMSSTFAADETLTVFNKNDPVSKIVINDGSSGLSNTDLVVITPAIAVQNSTGGNVFSSGFYVGDVINNGASANAEIVEIDGSTNTQVLILRIKPQTADLASSNSSLWTFYANDAIVSANTGQAATIKSLIGTGASATLVTDSVGQISRVAVVNEGTGYYINPIISIASTSANTIQIENANLVPQTYLTQLVVGNTSTTPIGSGFGVTVNEGVIYQKGFFARVDKQIVVVEKYSNTPDLKAIGFSTKESIVTSDIDPSLLDNATGTENYTAPGADRLKLTPVIEVLSSVEAEANTDFLPIASFSAGQPYKLNRQTQYNIIGDEMAKRTFDESGNYVLDQFILSTKSPTNFSDEANTFNILIDPGSAYINGYKVETSGNYNVAVSKGIDTAIANTTISLAYGNYIRIKEFAGSFLFSVGAQIGLYNDAKGFITNSAGSAISAPSNRIGYARIRSLVWESGVPGTPECVYKAYLFDVKMNPGTNFKNVKSIYYDGTFDGVADVVLTRDPTSNTDVAVLYDNNKTAMTFYGGIDSIKNANNVTYTYRTIDTSREANTSGFITKSLGAGESFPYSVTLSDTNELDLIVVPQSNLQSSANLTGSVTITSGNNILSGTSTAFLTELVSGDYVNVSNTTANATVRIVAVSNNTTATLSANAADTISGNSRIKFLQNIPISLSKAGRTANVSANGSLLTINLGTALTAGANVGVTLAYNVKSANTQPVSKSVKRNTLVRLNLSNNAANTVGPWCLGVSDVFRLKGVYLGSNNTFAANSSGVEDITNDFYIDHNQTENYYGISYLYKKPKSTLAISNTNVLLVKFDNFTTTSDGLKNVGGSYNIDDTKTLANSATTINSLEIPEMLDNKGTYYDLRDQMDFRPVSANTANAVANTAATATINPVEPSDSARFSVVDKKYPAPYSEMTCTLEYYLPRADRVVVDQRGDVRVLKGTSGSLTLPPAPDNSIVINNILIPPYPSLPQVMSSSLVEIADTKIANERFMTTRLNRYKISTPISSDQRSRLQPKGYRMQDIADLERRIADLEYYVSFTLAESLARNRIIPSTNDASVDRFKFGFFVDAFNNYNYADQSNPQYNASIEDGFLVPSSNNLVISYTPNLANTETVSALNGTTVSLPFTEFVVAQQTSATDGLFASNNTSNAQSIVCIVQNNRNSTVNENGSAWEETEYVFSNTTGPVEMYINSNDVNSFKVYYGNSAGFSTDTATVRYDCDDIVDLTTSDRNNTEKVGALGTLSSLDNTISGLGETVITGAGKLLWTHTPSLGRYVKIKATKYRRGPTSRSGFVYKMCYPTDSALVEANTVVSPPETFTYSGTISSVVPASFVIQSTFVIGGPHGVRVGGTGTLTAGREGGINSWIADSQKFTISVAGLKPNTIHKFMINNNLYNPNAVDDSAKCQQVGKLLGASLISDSEGKLVFDYYYDAGIDEATSDFTKANRLAALVVGIKTFLVTSNDSSSTATGTINITNGRAQNLDASNNVSTSTSDTNGEGDGTPYWTRRDSTSLL